MLSRLTRANAPVLVFRKWLGIGDASEYGIQVRICIVSDGKGREVQSEIELNGEEGICLVY